MRVRIVNGVQIVVNGTRRHLEPGEVHDVDREVARLLVAQGQAEATDDRVTTRDPTPARGGR